MFSPAVQQAAVGSSLRGCARVERGGLTQRKWKICFYIVSTTIPRTGLEHRLRVLSAECGKPHQGENSVDKEGRVSQDVSVLWMAEEGVVFVRKIGWANIDCEDVQIKQTIFSVRKVEWTSIHFEFLTPRIPFMISLSILFSIGGSLTWDDGPLLYKLAACRQHLQMLCIYNQTRRKIRCWVRKDDSQHEERVPGFWYEGKYPRLSSPCRSTLGKRMVSNW